MFKKHSIVTLIDLYSYTERRKLYIFSEETAIDADEHI